MPILDLAPSPTSTDPMLPEAAIVTRVTRETHDTVTLELCRTGGRPLPFLPGQFNMLYAFGAGESAISISGPPAQPERLIHTIRRVGIVTRQLTDLKKGQSLGVRGPFGRPWPLLEAEGHDVLIVAGGIGLAPLRPAIYEVLRQRERFGKVSILYGTRTPEDILFSKELERWRGRLDVQLEVTVDNSGPSWHGDVGVVTRLINRVSIDPTRTVAMTCGPEIMMRFVIRELIHRGLKPAHMYVTMERNMKCAVGFCGHCQLGPMFICRDGAVFSWPDIQPWFEGKEI